MSTKTKRMPGKKKFGGKVFDLVGTSPAKTKRLANEWADYNRRANNLLVRVVKAPYAGYEIYIRRNR